MSRGWLTVVLLSCTPPGAAAQDKERLKADEDLLRGGGVALDGDSLLEFFRVRTPGEKALQGIEGLIRDLGHDAFKVRHVHRVSIGTLVKGTQRRGRASHHVAHAHATTMDRGRKAQCLLMRLVSNSLR